MRVVLKWCGVLQFRLIIGQTKTKNTSLMLRQLWQLKNQWVFR